MQNFGYYFEQRGLVAVKGKGQLMTYYLQGKRDTPSGPADKHTVSKTYVVLSLLNKLQHGDDDDDNDCMVG